MSRKEAEFTTQLVASLIAAGVPDAYKIPDPSFGRSAGGGGSKRPCDVIGTLPGGRSLRIEVKQQRNSETTGRVLGFSPRRLEEHQARHLREVWELGGCAVVALVAWTSRVSWNLYLWTWGEFVDATHDLKRPIEQCDMMQTKYRPRSKGRWNLYDDVCVWSGKNE